MTTTIQNLDDLQDRRIMMDRDVPPYGYAFVILVGLFMIFLLVWSTRTNRIYVSQNSGTVQASNKTYINGFIKNLVGTDKYFFHVNNVLVDIVENDIVTFDLERGKRGMNAVNICTINNQLAV